MEIGTYLTGAFGQSRELYKIRNEAKRGRCPLELVEEQIVKDTKNIMDLQKNQSYVIDPAFSNFYSYEAFSNNLPMVDIGPQENWFNNNVFYWKPKIKNGLKLPDGGFSNNYHFSSFDINLLPNNKEKMAILPSPLSLLSLSDVEGYQNKKSAINDIGYLISQEAQLLSDQGFDRIQFDEPVLAYKQSLGSLTLEDLQLLEYSLEHFEYIDGPTTSLNTYFGDVAPIIDYLKRLPVDCIGIDATETSIDDIIKSEFDYKELALGLVDARSPSLENPEKLAEKLTRVYNNCGPSKLWLTPNTGTEYIGWTLGLEKMKILEKTRECIENEQIISNV